MRITVNGDNHEIDGPVTVSGLLALFELKASKIAVERNLEIVPKSSFESVQLQDGDKLEIIQFVGGG